MTNNERKILRLKFEIEWLRAKGDYVAAGKPFGAEGIDIWIEHGQLTTVN
jgi:hypothetical protein